MEDCPAVNCPRADCPVVNCPVSGELSELRRDSGRGVVEYMQISHCQGRRILTSALVSVSVFDLAKAHSDSLKLLHGHWAKVSRVVCSSVPVSWPKLLYWSCRSCWLTVGFASSSQRINPLRLHRFDKIRGRLPVWAERWWGGGGGGAGYRKFFRPTIFRDCVDFSFSQRRPESQCKQKKVETEKERKKEKITELCVCVCVCVCVYAVCARGLFCPVRSS